jgi:hypothetical protein
MLRSAGGARRLAPQLLPIREACDAVEVLGSAALKGARPLLRIGPEICDFEPDLGLERGQTAPQIADTVPADQRTTIPKDSGPMSACFERSETF